MFRCASTSKNIFTEHHATRFAARLSSTPKGIGKSLGIIRLTLNIARQSLISNPEKADICRDLRKADQVLGYVKYGIKFSQMPHKALSAYKSAYKTQEILKSISSDWHEYKSVKPKKIFEVTVHSAAALKKTLSVTKCVFFKPMHIIDKNIDIGPHGACIHQTWEYLALVKSGAKIYSHAGMIAMGSEKKTTLFICSMLETWKVVHVILKFNHIAIPPAASLTLSACKCLFAVGEIWIATK